MTDDILRTLHLQVGWASRSDWTVADGAERIAKSLRLVHDVWPETTEAFKTSRSAKQAFSVDDPDLAKRLAPAVRATRNRNIFKDSELFGDATLRPAPAGGGPMSMSFGQVATGSRWIRGTATVRVDAPLTAALVERPSAVLDLLTGLAEVWQARNAWFDTSRVRQEWSCWTGDSPVYSWATWLHSGWATVDTDGLDVDTCEVAGGKLVVLRVDPVAVLGDETREVGKDVIRQLAVRTIMADGRPLPEANERLRAALAAEAGA